MRKQRMQRFCGCVCAALTTTALLGGCTTTSARSSERGVTLVADRSPDPVLSDLPRPRGFQLVHEESMAAIAGDIRIARCSYWGSSSLVAVKRFYEEQMPRSGYSLTQLGLDGGRYALRFESAAETCTVRLREEAGRTKVVIEVLPKANQGSQRLSRPSRRPR